MNPTDLSKSLRRVALSIDNSKSPRKDLVLTDLKKIVASLDQRYFETDGSGFDVRLTNYSDMGTGRGTPGKSLVYQMADYLEANRSHAIEIMGEVAVWCGAGEDKNNYYYQMLPLTNPSDAEGGDLAAQEAVVEALESIGML